MNQSPLISICIPAYRNIGFLKRLLDSVAAQTFRDFEVIITDDSPDAGIEDLCAQYASRFRLMYQQNRQPLGTPVNWNAAINKASGQWVKLMHHDDWFASAESLQQFADTAVANPHSSFVFCAYRNIYEDNSPAKDVLLNSFDRRRLSRNPVMLLAANFIGPPSVVMHRNNKDVAYDEQLKWLVDSDFYIRYPGTAKAVYIASPLVCIGIHASQVTALAFGNRTVEVPEYLYELNKFGNGILRYVLVFDAYWRMVRNFRIRDRAEIAETGFKGVVPPAVMSMISFQRPFPTRLLRVGLFSKLCMLACYLYNRYMKNSLR